VTDDKRQNDRRYMEMALELAARGRGRTSPNPVVGAVLVKDGEVVGAGYHERYGSAHAEVNAIRQAGRLAEGATLYVTLEPCCVSGNTPPCTDAIIASRIGRVVVPVNDPNPDVDGRGVRRLREAGVDVETYLMKLEATRLNAPYFKHRATGLPLVTLKLAVSLDGRIAPPAGGPRWTSSPESREAVHAMRAETDCVMVGAGTVVADDPLLTDRRPGGGSRQPARLILDGRLSLPLESALVASARETRTVVACSARADRETMSALEKAGVEVWTFEAPEGLLKAREVLARAGSEGILSLLCEGGRLTATSLLNAGLVDRLAVFVAPRLHGSGGLGALDILGREWWGTAGRFASASWTPVGDDVLFEADVLPITGGAAPKTENEVEEHVHGDR
jgi:diaminohydroxyphosphoribosylaminopyrimidine deaminase/5-amino-6-(5-phosphoribosylamino)uracil reductase